MREKGEEDGLMIALLCWVTAPHAPTAAAIIFDAWLESSQESADLAHTRVQEQYKKVPAGICEHIVYVHKG